MQTALILDSNEQHKSILTETIPSQFQPLFCDDPTTAIEKLRDAQGFIRLIILNDENDPELVLPSYVRQSSVTRQIPMLLFSETTDCAFLERAFDSHIIDRISAKDPTMIIRNRIKQVTRHLSTKLDDYYVFGKYADASLLIEYEGGVQRMLMINDAFYQLVQKKETDFNEDSLQDTILPEDTPQVEKALEEVLATGRSRCLFHQEVTGQVFEARYHHIAHIDERDIIFVTLDDVTGVIENRYMTDSFFRLPGSTIFAYNPQSDSLVFHISQGGKLKQMESTDFLAAEKPELWLAPDSANYFRETLRSASQIPMNGSMNFRACFRGSKFSWHRMHYTSLADERGTIFRIIGRVDDAEYSPSVNNLAMDNSLVDASTQLLTFRALREYIETKLKGGKDGTLILLEVSGMKKLYDNLGEVAGNLMLTKVSAKLQKLFVDDDILGKYGDDGFLFFLPGVHSSTLAESRSKKLLKAIGKLFREYAESVDAHIGVAITMGENASLDYLMTKANTSLREAKTEPDGAFAINYEGQETHIYTKKGELLC